MAETLAGSFLGQQARAPGAADGVKVGDLSLGPAGTAAADALVRQGAARLKPYARPVLVPVAGRVAGRGRSPRPRRPPERLVRRVGL